MNAAPDQTIILGLQIFLDHRSLSSIDQKILMTLPLYSIRPFCLYIIHQQIEIWWDVTDAGQTERQTTKSFSAFLKFIKLSHAISELLS